VSITDDLATLKPLVRRKCRVGLWLDTLKDAERDAVEHYLDNRPAGVTWIAIADVLRGHGLDASHDAVAKHARRGESNGCRCGAE
jgi:hypothetical protein